ncbi:MAG: hypothetical protein IPP19_16865 [Verrucomicrobia bacterium]|nr:hypothetical protein [Verrucomicrobiota bacterium]
MDATTRCRRKSRSTLSPYAQKCAAEIAAPLEENGQTLGVINLDHDPVNGFQPIRPPTARSCLPRSLGRDIFGSWQLRLLRSKPASSKH